MILSFYSYFFRHGYQIRRGYRDDLFMRILNEKRAIVLVDSENLAGLLSRRRAISHLLTSHNKLLSVYIHKFSMVFEIGIQREKFIENRFRDDNVNRRVITLKNLAYKVSEPRRKILVAEGYRKIDYDILVRGEVIKLSLNGNVTDKLTVAIDFADPTDTDIMRRVLLKRG